MPFVQVFHPDGFDELSVTRLSETIHQSLVEAFGIATDDLFQVFSPGRPGNELRITPSFLGIEHSSSAIFVQITCAEGRTTAQKRALYASLVSGVQRATGLSVNDVIVNLVETRRENWSFGAGTAPFAAA